MRYSHCRAPRRKHGGTPQQGVTVSLAGDGGTKKKYFDMMKTTIKTLVAALAAVALTGCSQEEASVDTNKHPLELLATIAKQGTRASTTLQTDKVDETVTLGVFAWDEAGQLIGANVPYIYNSGSGKWVKKDDASSSIYFPMDGTPINITVYAPYDEAVAAGSIPTTLIPKADQTLAADYLASDLIKGEKTGVGYTATAVDVTMQHKMAKVTVTLKAGGGVTNADIEGAELVIGGIKATLQTGATSASVIVKPNQTFAAGTELISIDLSSGAMFTHTLTQDLTPAAGTEYVYKFSLTGTELKLEGTSVTDWTQADHGDNNSTMMPGDE